MGATLGDYAAATWCRHARAETVATLAYQFTWLIGPFHIDMPVSDRPSCHSSKLCTVWTVLNPLTDSDPDIAGVAHAVFGAV